MNSSKPILSEAEGGSGGRNRASILADTLEGVIGAIYLDGGLEPARQLTARLLLKEVHTILGDANLANYKSMLQEYVQGEFKTLLKVVVDNRPGVLATIAAAIAEAGSNIENVEYQERDGSSATLQFTLEVRDRKHLAQVMRRVRRAGVVHAVHRATT